MYTSIKAKECNHFIGIKIRIYPSAKQKKLIAINSGTSRAVYNKYIEINKRRYDLNKSLETETNIENIALIKNELQSIKDINANPTKLNAVFDWLDNKKLIDPQTKYLAKKDYQAAWNMWRKTGAKPPTFQKKSHIQSYSTSECKLLDNKHIRINKLGRLRVSGMRTEFIHKLLYVGRTTISKSASGKYYVSMQLGSVMPFVKQHEQTGSVIGVDLNLSNYLVTSDGLEIDNPKYLRKSEAKLKKAQREYSRRLHRAKIEKREIKSAKNLEKSRVKLALIHEKIANQRRNFAHKLSHDLVKNHDIIVFEDLKTSNMVKNHKVAKSISDASWNMFIGFVQYKAEMNDKIFLKVNPAYTTQTCNVCNHVMSGDEKIKLGVEQWNCPSCNTHHNRDHNAALNILNKGLEQLQ